MTKKKYMQPALEIMQAEAEQIVAISVTGVQTDGLGSENLNVGNDQTQPKEKDLWDDSW